MSGPFDDRTSHWISDTFGSDHDAYAAFKRNLGTEYDTNFAYRLTAALRNASAHVVDVLSHRQRHARVTDEGTATIHEIAIDRPRIGRDKDECVGQEGSGRYAGPGRHRVHGAGVPDVLPCCVR